MTLPRHSPLAWRLFDAGFGWWRRGRLGGVHVAGLPHADALPPGPLLVVANHVSWWDGFLVREVHRALRPEGAFHTVMLQRQLERHGFLRWLGAIPIAPGLAGGHRTLLDALRRIGRESPGPLVLFFPQGELRPAHARPLGFQPGVRAVWRALGEAAVLPVAIHLAPGKTPGHEVWISAGPVIPPGDPAGGDARVLERAVEDQLDRIFSFLALHGERAAAHWPRGGSVPPLAVTNESDHGRPHVRT